MKEEKELMTKSLLETAESASVYAEARLEEVISKHRKQKIKLIKITGMMIIVSVILVFATRSWFTMSKEVEGTGANMTASDLPFELSVDSPYAKRPDYTSIVSSVFGYDTVEHKTGGTVDSIKMLMNDETYDVNNPTRGIKPGSRGTISFNIIPKRAGTYTINFDLSLTAYHAEFATDAETGMLLPESIQKDAENKYIIKSLIDYAAEKQTEYADYTSAGESANAQLALKEKNECLDALKYLNGHILFFKNRDSSTGYYSSFIEPGVTFSETMTFTQAEVDAQIEKPITFYWVWPNTFGQFLLDSNNPNLHDIALFSTAQSAVAGVKPRAQLLNYIYANNNFQYFFLSNNANLSSSAAVQSCIEGAMGSSPDNLIALSNGYNNADQIIGENVQLLFSKVTVGTTI